MYARRVHVTFVDATVSSKQAAALTLFEMSKNNFANDNDAHTHTHKHQYPSFSRRNR